jgi:hypothetical protein
MEPRGIRNCNPGNVRKSQTAWQGLAPVQSDPDFFICESMAYGVRMSAMIVLHYAKVLGLKTVRQIITRWAPPVENDTEAYIASVAKFMAVNPDHELNVIGDAPELEWILDAIFNHENGCDVFASDLLRGCAMALAT